MRSPERSRRKQDAPGTRRATAASLILRRPWCRPAPRLEAQSAVPNGDRVPPIHLRRYSRVSVMLFMGSSVPAPERTS